jgi:Flp pilus assembly protein TadG
MTRQASHAIARRRPRRKRKDERGATMVEVIVTLPLAFMVLFGIVEASRLMSAYTTLSDAARAGTRYAIVHGSYRTGGGVDGPSGPGNTGNVADKVKAITTAAGFPVGDVTVLDTDEEPMYPDGNNNIGARVRVRVSFTYNSIVLPFVAPLSIPLGSVSEGRICY